MNQILIDACLILYIFSLSIILLYSSHGFVMIYYKKKYGSKTHLKDPEQIVDKIVTIQLPIYNEKFVVERLINSVCELDYPKDKLEIQVLDDSTDETSDIVQKIVEMKKNEGINIFHLKRESREGYKAGALKEGMEKASGEFIAIFDADFIPKKSFLRETLCYFTSNKIGMVQSRWEHLNKNESLLTQVQTYGLNGHFVIEQSVRNNSGFFINFNGTAGILTRECIEDSGGWQGDTITEDLDLSYRAQLKDWQFIYLKDFTTPDELPTDIDSLKAQQFRWTKGAIETAKKVLRKVWQSSFDWKIKLQATFHLTNNFVFPFILLAGILNVPIVFIKATGNYNPVFNWMSIFGIAFVSSFLLYYNAQSESSIPWIKKIIFFPLFLASSMGLSLNNSKAVFEGLINKKTEFVRTPKYLSSTRQNNFIGKAYIPKINLAMITSELLLAAFCFIGVAASLYTLDVAGFFFNFLFFIGFGAVSVLSLWKSLFNKSIM